MRLFSLFGPTTAASRLSAQLWLLVALWLPSVFGVTFTSVPSPDLDLSRLGRVALTGDFDAISLYTYQQQNENSFSTNGSQSLLSPMSNGAFATLDSADASILAMCPFVLKNGTLSGVIVGGNFTSLGGIEAQGIAMVDPSTSRVTPLTGLSGMVSAVFCDQSSNTVFVGGDFKGGNSTNAIAWVADAGWTNLPFAGFNGPVSTIAPGPNGNVLFGGSFTGIGNTTTPAIQDQQIVNIASANISADGSTTTDGFSDPKNIICKTQGIDGTGNTWLLEDDSPGSWRADMGFGYEPTKLRIWNTHQDGRGTKTFRFTAFPINGIMNFTYMDPATRQNASCSSTCPLSNDPSVKYQDFRFVNIIGMNSFQIDISDWYGNGGGLDGIELFQDGKLQRPSVQSYYRFAKTILAIFAYAVEDLNEPACANIAFGSNSTTTGPWSVTPSGVSGSEYLTVNLSGPSIDSNSASVVFEPDIKQSGNYTVIIFTPGCQHDNSCNSRGIANVTGNFATGTQSTGPTQTQIFQTNDFDKYDPIYSGYVDANSDTFRPKVTLTPNSGQSNISLVAQRVQFQLQAASSGGLNGLFEYNPNQVTVNMDFSSSNFNAAGTNLANGALISSLSVIDGVAYVAGNFSASGIENIFSIANSNSTALPNGGLNSAVLTGFVYGNVLYLGGNFSNTANLNTPGLSNVAAFDTTKQAWQPLAAGVNGRVKSIVPLMLNVTANQSETCITVNGDFDQVLASGSNQAFAASTGFAVWVPSQNNWLQNLNVQTTAFSGQLTTATNISGNSPLLAGTLVSQGMSYNDAVELSTSVSSGAPSLNQLGVRIQLQSVGPSAMRKRAINGQNVTGAVTGLFNSDSGRNVTVIGGHFTATASNGSTISNLALINSTGSGGQTVTGITGGVDEDSVFLALAVQGDNLYAGGTVSGTVDGGSINGLVLWDLAQETFASPQPPALSGSNVAVNAIVVQPNTAAVYVAGNFDNAGSLNCPSICNFNNGQWSRPGLGIGGSVASLTWQGTNTLLVGGNLTVSTNTTTLANYDTNKQVWSSVAGADTAIPGPVTALISANNDASAFWVAGKSGNGSAFLIKYDGTKFNSVGDILGQQTTIRGLSMLTLSKNHQNNPLVDPSMVLLLTGQLNLPNFGNASAALFNGTTFSPFILSNSGNGPGSLSQMFTEKQISFNSQGTFFPSFSSFCGPSLKIRQVVIYEQSSSSSLRLLSP